MVQKIVNNNDGGGVARAAINDNFTELYAVANAAQITANSAQSTANTAQSTANTAQSTAEAAQLAAGAAQSTASTALSTATTAQSLAESAQMAANAAQFTADGKQNPIIAGNNITIESDGRTINATGGTPADFVSIDSPNALMLGTDDKLFVAPAETGGVQTVVAGASETLISVDNTDVRNPQVKSTTELQDAVAEIGTLQTDVFNIKTDITDIQGDIISLKNDVTEIQGDVITIKSDITEIQGDITTIQGDIITVQGDITDIKQDITTINTDIFNMSTDITNLTTDISNINTDITVINNKVDQVTGLIPGIRKVQIIEPQVTAHEDVVAVLDLANFIAGNIYEISPETDIEVGVAHTGLEENTLLEFEVHIVMPSTPHVVIWEFETKWINGEIPSLEADTISAIVFRTRDMLHFQGNLAYTY